MSKRIVIACGGTGGHLFPGIAVGEALQRRGHNVLALISEKNIDALATQGYDDLRFERVPAIGMPKLLSPAMLKFSARILKTYSTCKKIIGDFEADAVLGMGGFTSMPPIVAGSRKKLPTFIHDSNSIPGKANKLTARFVHTVLLGLEDCAQFFPKRNVEIVGTPLRTSLVEPIDKSEAYAFFGLDPNKRTLVVMGGSQGARGVNNAVTDALAHLDAATVQVVHLTGQADLETVEKSYASSGVAHHVAAFCHRMEYALAVADVGISRSGASSLTELSHFGLPSILIPYPYAAEDHQLRNAEVFGRADAAVVMEEKDLDGQKLGAQLASLLGDDARRTEIAGNCRSLARPDAAERICDIIESACI